MNGITGTAMPYFKRDLESEKIWDVSNYVAVYVRRLHRRGHRAARHPRLLRAAVEEHVHAAPAGGGRRQVIALTAQGALLAVWIAFTVLALIAIIAVFVWAVRARQFSDQDRARHLPLRSGIPRDEVAPRRRRQGRGQRAGGRQACFSLTCYKING